MGIKTLSSFWALILQALGCDGDMQEFSGNHRRSLTQCNYIKNKMISRVEQITSPGWLHETSARAGWSGRREGGAGWGIHVNPWLIHVNVWQKPLQYCKVISLQLIKINWKKFFLK